MADTIVVGQQYGVSPSGATKPILLNGQIFITQTPLVANAVATTNWLPVGNYMSLLYIIQADQVGTISAVEYSTDGINVNASGTGRAYITPGRLVQVALTLKDVYFRLSFTNGSTAQTSFYMECKVSTALFQNTMASVHLSTGITNIASLVKAIPEADDGTGTFAQVYRTGNALNVNITNTTPQSVSGTVAVSNLPATQSVSGTVAISNLPATQAVSGSVSVANFPSSQAVTGTFFQATQPITATALPLPAGAGTEATLQLINTALAALQTALNSINTDQGAPADSQATNSTASWGEISLLKGIMQRPATSSITSVTTLATTTLILAANVNRKGAAIFSVTGTVLISLGTQNSAVLFTSRLTTNAYYEVPFGFTGAIYGIGAGTVTATELT